MYACKILTEKFQNLFGKNEKMSHLKQKKKILVHAVITVFISETGCFELNSQVG